MESKPRVRFAPSPTGPLHIGGVRTALFNYLFARRYQGTFILRIEDTDQVRFVEGAEEYILESLRWLGIEPDEGFGSGGPFAPYRQSERKSIYDDYVSQLLKAGHAYYAFDTPEELEALRKKTESEGVTFTYGPEVRGQANLVRNSLTLGMEKALQLMESGRQYTVRFKVPDDKAIIANDLIRGKVEFNTSLLDDKVLFKSDGLPTYHLANIVDDHLMHITHVIRGEEWLPSLPLHLLLYEAFGWEPPAFAHLPLILKPSGQGKLSKRDGDKEGFPVFPLEWLAPDGAISPGYREEGYLPEAVVNMLALLGWNPGTEQEIFSKDELAGLFSFDKVQKGGARFDPAKAKWFNHQYIITKSNDELTVLFMAELKRRGIPSEKKFVSRVCDLVKERVELLGDLWGQSSYFFINPDGYDPKVKEKCWLPDTPMLLQTIKERILVVEPFTSAGLEDAVKTYITGNNLPFGKVMNPLRLALVGASKGPHLFDIMELLGKECTAKRIEKAIGLLG